MNGHDAMLTEPQKQASLDLLESMLWSDVDNRLRVMEISLRLALYTTMPYFDRAVGLDLSVLDHSSEDVDEMYETERLELVARLLRWVVHSYGATSDLDTAIMLVGENYPDTPAAVLRGLNDVMRFGR